MDLAVPLGCTVAVHRVAALPTVRGGVRNTRSRDTARRHAASAGVRVGARVAFIMSVAMCCVAQWDSRDIPPRTKDADADADELYAGMLTTRDGLPDAAPIPCTAGLSAAVQQPPWEHFSSTAGRRFDPVSELETQQVSPPPALDNPRRPLHSHRIAGVLRGSGVENCIPCISVSVGQCAVVQGRSLAF